MPKLCTSYGWDSSINTATSFKTAWNQGRSAWVSSDGANFTYLSNCTYKQGLMNKNSSSYFGEIKYTSNIWNEITAYTPYINIGNSNINTSNVARSTATHELGYDFGLEDLSSGTTIMNGNRNRSSIYTPQSIDISRVNSLYK